MDDLGKTIVTAIAARLAVGIWMIPNDKVIPDYWLRMGRRRGELRGYMMAPNQPDRPSPNPISNVL